MKINNSKINRLCLFIFMCLPFVPAFAQLKNTGFYGTQQAEDVCNRSAAMFDDQEVIGLVTSMCEKMYVKNRYIIKSCSRIANCQATMYNGQAYILYNNNFLASVKGLNFSAATLRDGNIDWKILAVLAHELGHHVNLHLINPDPKMSQIEMELEADEFSGHMLRLLGATLAQAQAVMYDPSVGIRPTNDHPGRNERLAAVKKGWDNISQLILLPHDNIPVITHIKDIEMVPVPGGTFNMGGDKYDDEKPVHRVTLSGFKMGRYDITQAQWKAVMGSNPSYHKDCDQCPVENVSWDDAQLFIKKLNALTGKQYRLPTEAEWEYAARGGSQSRGYTYAGSNSIDDVAWYDSNSGGASHPVGGKKANELGLYDMSGNVWQWCVDRYGAYSAGEQSDPKGPEAGSCRVLRGGGWGSAAVYCRSARRGGNSPGNHILNNGIRLASPQ